MRAAGWATEDELSRPVAMGSGDKIVHALFLLIPEAAAVVKHSHKLLREGHFQAARGSAGLHYLPGRSFSPLRLGNDAAVDVAHALHATERHAHIELAGEDVDRRGHSRLATGTETINVRAADQTGARAACERAQHVLAGADAAVEHHLDDVAHRIDHFGQRRDGGWRAVEL